MKNAVKKNDEASGKIAGPVPRAHQIKKVWVVKAGEEPIELDAHNATDFINIRGYRLSSPPKEKAVEVESHEEDNSAGVTEKKVEKTPDPAAEAFEALRAEAVALGVEVDKRWGAKKLREAIEAAKAVEDAE